MTTAREILEELVAPLNADREFNNWANIKKSLALANAFLAQPEQAEPVAAKQAEIDLMCHPESSSDYCSYCSRNMTNTKDGKNIICPARYATYLTTIPDSQIEAFGCYMWAQFNDVEGAERCVKWCHSPKCPFSLKSASTPKDRDAERYRWLRAEHFKELPLAAVSWKKGNNRDTSKWVNLMDGNDLDQQIDAAIAKEGK